MIQAEALSKAVSIRSDAIQWEGGFTKVFCE